MDKISNIIGWLSKIQINVDIGKFQMIKLLIKFELEYE